MHLLELGCHQCSVNILRQTRDMCDAIQYVGKTKYISTTRHHGPRVFRIMAAWLSLGNSKENTAAVSKHSLPKQHDSERGEICMFSSSPSTAPSPSSHLLQSLPLPLSPFPASDALSWKKLTVKKT